MWLNKRNSYLLTGLKKIYTSTCKSVFNIFPGNCSFLFSTGTDAIGDVGVAGPDFMPYPETISQVDRFSAYFSKILSKNPMEV